MLKAVITDIDGTILDTERIYIRAWKEAGREMGYEIPDEALMKTRAISNKDAAAVLASYLGEAFSYWECRKRRVVIAERLICDQSPLLLPGAAKMMAYLKENGIPIAAATSTDREKTMIHLAESGIDTAFDAIVTGDMIEHGKPAPDIFLKAAELLGVLPEDCVVLEDSHAGIRAAHAAGMKGIYIPNVVPATEELIALCYAYITSLEEVIPYLAALQ